MPPKKPAPEPIAPYGLEALVRMANEQTVIVGGQLEGRLERATVHLPADSKFLTDPESWIALQPWEPTCALLARAFVRAAPFVQQFIRDRNDANDRFIGLQIFRAMVLFLHWANTAPSGERGALAIRAAEVRGLLGEGLARYSLSTQDFDSRAALSRAATMAMDILMSKQRRRPDIEFVMLRLISTTFALRTSVAEHDFKPAPGMETDAWLIEQNASAQRIFQHKLFHDQLVEHSLLSKLPELYGAPWEIWTNLFLSLWQDVKAPNASLECYWRAPHQLWRGGAQSGARLIDAPAAISAYITVCLANRPTGMPAAEEQTPQPESVEAQELTGVRFEITGDGKIDLDLTPGADALRDDAFQRDLYQELWSAVEEATVAFSASNLLRVPHTCSTKFLESLGTNPRDLIPALAILRGNRLRVELGTDERRREINDPDAPEMPAAAHACLRQAVEAWNIYVAADPYLQHIDASRTGPDGKHPEVSGDAVSAAITKAEAEGLATAEAIEALQSLEQIARSGTLDNDRAAAFREAAFRNFARAVLKLSILAYRISKGLGSATIGAGAFVATLYGAVSWVVATETTLRTMLAGNPTMISVLDWVVRVSRSVPGL